MSKKGHWIPAYAGMTQWTGRVVSNICKIQWELQGVEVQGLRHARKIASDNVISVLKGEAPQTCINPEVLK